MKFSELLTKRYAAKSFSDKNVGEEDLQKILEDTRMASSSFGLQPYMVYIIENKELQQKLQAASWNQQQIGQASHVLVFCALTNITERIKGYEEMMKEQGVPEEKIATYTGMMKGYAEHMNEEQTAAWAAKQAYIALDVAMHAAIAQGIDSCPMEGFDPQKYSEILELPKEHKPCVVLPLGYANDEPKPKLRYKQEDLYKRIR